MSIPEAIEGIKKSESVIEKLGSIDYILKYGCGGVITKVSISVKGKPNHKADEENHRYETKLIDDVKKVVSSLIDIAKKDIEYHKETIKEELGLSDDDVMTLSRKAGKCKK